MFFNNEIYSNNDRGFSQRFVSIHIQKKCIVRKRRVRKRSYLLSYFQISELKSKPQLLDVLGRRVSVLTEEHIHAHPPTHARTVRTSLNSKPYVSLAQYRETPETRPRTHPKRHVEGKILLHRENELQLQRQPCVLRESHGHE